MTAPTFLELYESPSRGGTDWTIHRGGTLFFEAVSDVLISDCTVRNTGGNGVFLSNAAVNVTVQHCAVGHTGDSAIAVVGDMARSTGLSGRNYPENITIHSNAIHDLGVYGKQVSGVFVAVAASVNVSNNVFTSGPSSAVKLNDGFHGGHTIAYNHMVDFPREVSCSCPTVRVDAEMDMLTIPAVTHPSPTFCAPDSHEYWLDTQCV